MSDTVGFSAWEIDKLIDAIATTLAKHIDKADSSVEIELGLKRLLLKLLSASLKDEGD